MLLWLLYCRAEKILQTTSQLGGVGAARISVDAASTQCWCCQYSVHSVLVLLLLLQPFLQTTICTQLDALPHSRETFALALRHLGSLLINTQGQALGIQSILIFCRFDVIEQHYGLALPRSNRWVDSAFEALVLVPVYPGAVPVLRVLVPVYSVYPGTVLQVLVPVDSGAAGCDNSLQKLANCRPELSALGITRIAIICFNITFPPIYL